MPALAGPLQRLIDELSRLPGVGPKTASLAVGYASWVWGTPVVADQTFGVESRRRTMSVGAVPDFDFELDALLVVARNLEMT